MSPKKVSHGKSMVASKDEKIAELKAALIKEKASESKALAIVESLIDNPVNAEQLKKSCRHISRAHYEDIVQERSLLLNCGYPLCSEKLVTIPKKKFHVSLKYNKVFDITERKNFCSNHCFKASKHLESQLDSTNVWLNDDSRMVSEITILNADDKVEIFRGTEVDIGQVSSIKDLKIKDMGADNREFDPLSDPSIDGELIAITVNEGCRTVDKQKRAVGSSGVKPKDGRVIVDTKQANSGVASNTPSRQTPLLLVENCLKEWFTQDSAEFLIGQEMRGDTDVCETATKRTLKIGKDYDNKVHSFYSGRFEIPPPQNVEGIREINLDDDEVSKPIMPLVDCRAQNTLRRRIVLERLNLVSTELFRAMGVASSEVKNDVRQLVHTFRLKSTNISLKPAEWSVVVIVLLHLLTVRNNSLRAAFATESSKKFLKILLNSFGKDFRYLERTRDWLMDCRS